VHNPSTQTANNSSGCNVLNCTLHFVTGIVQNSAALQVHRFNSSGHRTYW